MKGFLMMSLVCTLFCGSKAGIQTGPLTIDLHNSSTTFKEGDTAHFSCQLAEKQTIRRDFWKNDSIVVTQYEHDLYIHNLKPSDSGLYWCSLTDTGLSSKNSIKIQVTPLSRKNTTSKTTPHYKTTPLPGVPTLILHEQTTSFYEGAGIHFSCHASGYGSNVSYELTKDEQYVSTQKGSDFYLYNLQVSDTGRYRCAVLLVYRKVYSHNTVFVEVKAYRGGNSGDDDERYPGTATSLVSGTFFITTLMMLMKGILME